MNILKFHRKLGSLYKTLNNEKTSQFVFLVVEENFESTKVFSKISLFMPQRVSITIWGADQHS